MSIKSEIVANLAAAGWSLRSNSVAFTAGDYVSLCGPSDGTEVKRWTAAQWAENPSDVMHDILLTAATAVGQKVCVDGELVLRLAGGSTLRGGTYSTDKSIQGTRYGDYVRVCDSVGGEYIYWDSSEWRDDPELVMGALINAAAGLRIYAKSEAH